MSEVILFFPIENIANIWSIDNIPADTGNVVYDAARMIIIIGCTHKMVSTLFFRLIL